MKKIILILILLISIPENIYSKKVALIVSISEFKDNFSKISSNNDKFLLLKSLKEQGFNDIRTVSEKSATKKGILKSINSFITQLKNGDIVCEPQCEEIAGQPECDTVPLCPSLCNGFANQALHRRESCKPHHC